MTKTYIITRLKDKNLDISYFWRSPNNSTSCFDFHFKIKNENPDGSIFLRNNAIILRQNDFQEVFLYVGVVYSCTLNVSCILNYDAYIDMCKLAVAGFGWALLPSS